jgi:hypothetical protein
VVAELEAVTVKLLDDTGITSDPLPDDEEGGRNVKPPQLVGDLRGPVGIRAVVEGERDLVVRGRLPGDQPVTGGANDGAARGDVQSRLRVRIGLPGGGSAARARQLRGDPLGYEEQEEREQDQQQD